METRTVLEAAVPTRTDRHPDAVHAVRLLDFGPVLDVDQGQKAHVDQDREGRAHLEEVVDLTLPDLVISS